MSTTNSASSPQHSTLAELDLESPFKEAPLLEAVGLLDPLLSTKRLKLVSQVQVVGCR